MKRVARITLGSALLTFLLLAGKAGVALADTSEPDLSLEKPSVELQPGEVVEIVIDALAKNDFPFPDAGIATTFNFASPANKANIGPLERFRELVKGPTFGSMIKHRDSTLSKVVIIGNKALRLVQIVDSKNEVRYFAFRLELQQQGDYAGMWLTDAVWPLEEYPGEVLAL